MRIGLPGILFVVFLVLKLTGYIDWSWLWVSAPLWISAAVGIVAYIGISIAALVSAFRKVTK